MTWKPFPHYWQNHITGDVSALLFLSEEISTVTGKLSKNSRIASEVRRFNPYVASVCWKYIRLNIAYMMRKSIMRNCDVFINYFFIAIRYEVRRNR